MNTSPAMLRNGTYFAVMRVNGRAIMGIGHTITEAKRNTWQEADRRHPEYEHVFAIMRDMGYTPEVCA